MAHTVKRVGVIGAGVSGVAAAAYLRTAGLEVIVFERSSVAGGVWYAHQSFVARYYDDSNYMFRVFDPRLPPEPPYPSIKPSLADFTTLSSVDQSSLGDSEQDILSLERDTSVILHAPPG